MTTSTNLWKAVYKLASGKLKNSSTMITLTGWVTNTNLNETAQCMLQYLILLDEKINETDYHKQVRTATGYTGQPRIYIRRNAICYRRYRSQVSSRHNKHN